MPGIDYVLHPIGFLHSSLKDREEAPSQGNEGAPDAWLEVNATVAEGLAGIEVGAEILLLTWFHKSRRDILKLHPRWDKNNPLDRCLCHTLSRSTKSTWLTPGNGAGNRRAYIKSRTNRSD